MQLDSISLYILIEVWIFQEIAFAQKMILTGSEQALYNKRWKEIFRQHDTCYLSSSENISQVAITVCIYVCVIPNM